MIDGELVRLPAKSPQVWPLSVSAYHALGQMGLIPEPTELLYGSIFKKMSKSPLHSALVQRLLRLLREQLPGDCFVRQEQPLTCVDSEPEPDLAVIRGREEDFWDTHPTTAELVVEVAVTSREYDRTKTRAYAQAGVKEFWLVIGPEQQIEVFRTPVAGQFTSTCVLGVTNELTAETLPGIRLSPSQLFLRQP
jgi:Uma2 family endonuclease